MTASWRTAEVVAAEDVLNRAVAEAERAVAEAERLRVPAVEPSAEDVRRIIAFAKSGEASPELRALQRRIAAGVLSWRQVLMGEAGGDAVVRAALAADRDRITELMRGERPAPRPRPVVRDDDEEGEAPTVTEDAW
ncbi:hypothetical protein [Umezawaea beigongshangensis]|uniref:hypothetical protein n=1 Tax=Umezawaea beigongshangensis TaxID=2780383 RepID=UPI0018F26EA6|nr:hypothetical protein [Umezawaea beigongshangensis]